MSVASHLGFGLGMDSPPLVEAAQRWPHWGCMDAAESGCASLSELPSWLTSVRPYRADQVLIRLTEVGSPEGEDEACAVNVVAWLLVPGARSLAHRLRTLTPHIDEVVAAQLWLEIRAFPWWRLRKVAANVLARTRSALIADHAPGSARRSRRFLEVPIDPQSSWWLTVPGSADCRPDPADELADVLATGRASGLLNAADQSLLMICMNHADQAGGGAGRGKGGLLAKMVVEGAAAETGISPATIRRRLRRAVAALAEAHRADAVDAA